MEKMLKCHKKIQGQTWTCRHGTDAAEFRNVVKERDHIKGV